MTSNLELWQLILGASLPVKLVMLILLLASFGSWIAIFQKWISLGRAKREAQRFEEKFWSGADLTGLYNQQNRSGKPQRGMSAIFQHGFKEFIKVRQNRGIDARLKVESADRAMRVRMNREMDGLESGLNFLATVGSTSPYIGLFGTVWGIMISFHALGNVANASIAMVAPGISEALIATAMGLFAAIPAVVGYNRFANRVERIELQYENFRDEFSSILQRQAHAGVEG
ncbi:MAG: protein TolQ [bacterium]